MITKRMAAEEEIQETQQGEEKEYYSDYEMKMKMKTI